jgi:hypothetical protein
LRTSHEHVALSGKVGRRAREPRARGIGDLDALHPAVEQGGAEVLITTDDRFITAARMVQLPSTVRVENPVIFELEAFR